MFVFMWLFLALWRNVVKHNTQDEFLLGDIKVYPDQIILQLCHFRVFQPIVEEGGEELVSCMKCHCLQMQEVRLKKNKKTRLTHQTVEKVSKKLVNTAKHLAAEKPHASPRIQSVGAALRALSRKLIHSVISLDKLWYLFSLWTHAKLRSEE